MKFKKSNFKINSGFTLVEIAVLLFLLTGFSLISIKIFESQVIPFNKNELNRN